MRAAAGCGGRGGRGVAGDESQAKAPVRHHSGPSVPSGSVT